jgi:hypothetical protein
MLSFLTGIPIIAKVAAIGVVLFTIGGVIFAGYTHYNNILADRETAILQANTLTIKNSVQTETIKQQQDVVKAWKSNVKHLQQTIDRLDKARIDATSEYNRVKDILNKHDLDKLSLAKPGLIENRINRGTAGVLRMYETTTNRSTHKTGNDRPSGKTNTP